MGCCGDRRRQASTWSSPTPTTHARSVTHPFNRPASSETVRVTYSGDTPVVVTGPRSGRLYRIEPEAREVVIDQRDMPALLATGRFTRIEV
jgi:hypothetical protein